jgi:hypothetical protein
MENEDNIPENENEVNERALKYGDISQEEYLRSERESLDQNGSIYIQSIDYTISFETIYSNTKL